jgi:tRNA threonylcarbamoyladenosine modification (KEOPS) complex  Pcc1 subunit
MDLGKNAKDIVRILGKEGGRKRSTVEYKSGKGTLEIKVTASDPVALVSSLNGVLKQLKIITNVEKTVSRLTNKSGQENQ